MEVSLPVVDTYLPFGSTVGVLDNWKFTEVYPDAEAVTLYDPVVPLAVNTDVEACPFASVTTVVTFVLVALNMALAPPAGAVKVTLTPLTGVLFASNTNATSGAEKLVLIMAD